MILGGVFSIFSSFWKLVGEVIKYGFFGYLLYLAINLLRDALLVVKVRGHLSRCVFKPKLLDFLKWLILDARRRAILPNKEFIEFGLTLYANKQGSGKTLSLVEYLERMKKKYPKVKVYTNFGYSRQDGPIDGWKDLISLRNGSNGVIFAIDELQNEWDSNAYKDVPEWILGEITQQRKQYVKIVSTSQVFTRVAKQFREQCFDVVECQCLFGRWVFQKSFDAYEYEAVISNPDKKMKLHRRYRRSFIADDYLRSLFDTRLKISRIGRDGFKSRPVRVEM